MSLVNHNRLLEKENPGLQRDQLKNSPISKGKILLFSYAFPPMQVQMTPAVFKTMAALSTHGYSIDVLCADSFSPHLPLDNSLLHYVDKFFSKVYRLNPPGGFWGMLHRHSKVMSRVPDLMTVLHRPAYEHLMGMDLELYDAVITWSPFHSINPVMVRVKKARKGLRWIAQFCDPWAGNPLEKRMLIKLWNRWHEPRTLDTADFVIHSSPYSLELMLNNYSKEIQNKADVLPHVFNEDLYPQRPKAENSRLVMRYLGVLYGRRSPDPLFQALNQLFERRKDLKGKLQIELIGLVPPEMLKTPSALLLPEGTVKSIAGVDYIHSLELMYDADILLLIEADISQNLFLPSKLSDYLGAGSPIVGIVPPGASEDAVRKLGTWYARTSDINGIEKAIEGAVDHVISASSSPWCDESARASFSGSRVAVRYAEIINGVR